MEKDTIVERLREVAEDLTQLRLSEHGRAAREFALALTHVDDAVMRVERGFYIKHDRFTPKDGLADRIF